LLEAGRSQTPELSHEVWIPAFKEATSVAWRDRYAESDFAGILHPRSDPQGPLGVRGRHPYAELNFDLRLLNQHLSCTGLVPKRSCILAFQRNAMRVGAA